MFIHVFIIATLYYMLSTLFYTNFSFYGLNSNKGYKSVRKPSHLPISLPTKWSRQATLQEMTLNGAIDSFILAVGLRVIYGCHGVFDGETFEEQLI